MEDNIPKKLRELEIKPICEEITFDITFSPWYSLGIVLTGVLILWLLGTA